MEIKATLRTIRSRLDLTQQQLADRLGVSFATVNRWEGGMTKPQKAAQEAIAALAAEAEVDEAEATIEPTEAAARITRRRARSTQRAPSPSTKPMEQMLWDAACSIRGEKDAAKFKDYLLPLLFLKRLSDVFDDEIGRLAEEYDDRATALEIAESDHELLRFYLSPEARWAVINGRESYEWPLDDRKRSTRPKDSRRTSDQGGAGCRPAEPPRSRASSTSSISRPSATASATSIRPSLSPWSRPSQIPVTGSASPTCNPTSSVALTSICYASSRKVPARARVSSSPRPKSVS